MIDDEKQNSPKRPLLVVDAAILADSLHRRKGGCMVRNTRQWLYLLLALIIVIIVYRWLIARPAYDYAAEVDDFNRQRNKAVNLPDPDPPGPPKELSIVKLDAYIEAKCPDTTRFVHSQLWPTWRKLGKGNRFQVRLIPFGKARCHEKDNDFVCDCQHGPNECILNQLMNCVIDAHPRTEDHLEYIRCIQGKNDLNDARNSCLNGHPQLNVKRLMECTEGPRGRRLLALAGEKTQALDPKMYFVPWTVVDGKRTEEALEDLTGLVCSRLTHPKLKECY